MLSRKSVFGLIALAFAAAAVTWMATAGLRSSNERSPLDEAPAARAASTPNERAVAMPAIPPASASSSAAATEPPAVTSRPSKQPPVLSLDAPPLVDAAGPVDPTLTLTGAILLPIKAGDPEAAKALLSSTHLYCKFADGSSGNASDDSFKPGGAFFAAGPVTFEVLDLSAGKAQMTGDRGSASSPTGVSAMRVTGTESTLNFSGITPLGEIVLTTVFATKSPTGKFTAVTSRHGMREPHISAQFYGSCEGDAEK